MNKQIQQLAKEAGFAMDISNDPNSPPSWHGHGHNTEFEKFAWLIIQQCGDIADESVGRGIPSVYIDRYFGEK